LSVRGPDLSLEQRNAVHDRTTLWATADRRGFLHKQADEILDDEELSNTVYEALRRRHPQSATRGRMGTPAETVIRLMVLKHVRGWSYETLASYSDVRRRIPVWS
jgi:hypothetical protein